MCPAGMRLGEGSSDGEDGQQTPSTQPGQQERDAGGDASTSGNGGDAISDSKAGKGAGSKGAGGLGQASANGAALTCGTRAAGQQQEGHEGEGEASSDPEDDLQPNMNRRVLVHQYSGSDDSDEE